MSWQRYNNGVLTQTGDDATQTVTDYNPDGSVASTRPFSPADTDREQREARLFTLGASLSADQANIVQTALVQLASDATAATTRAVSIDSALSAVQQQITAVQGYTFTAATVADVVNSLNNALKPQLVTILQRQQAIGQILADQETHRAQVDQDLIWIGHRLTGTT